MGFLSIESILDSKHCGVSAGFLTDCKKESGVICKSTCQENYIPAVMLPPNPTSPPSMAAIFLATRLMAVLQPSGYSVFHGGDTPIQLGLP